MLLGLTALLTPTRGRANGRLPNTNQLVLHPTRPGVAVIRATFGLLLTDNDGASWTWVCEQAVGFSGIQDPPVAWTEDGSLLVAANEGVAVTHDGGCSFAFVEQGLRGETIVDVTVDKADPKRAIVVTATPANEETNGQLFASPDNGRTWAALGTAFDRDVHAETVDLAPSHSQRIYVSGFTKTGGTREGVVLVSKDSGSTWTRTAVPLVGEETAPFLAAIDPQDPDRLYLRTDGATAGRLLVSTDGGATFNLLVAVPAPIKGFALSPDGSRVAFGSPSAKVGLQVAARGESVFQQRSDEFIGCLAWGPQGLDACRPLREWSASRSVDEGASWNTLGVLDHLLTCPASSPYAQRCEPAWPTLQADLVLGPPSTSSRTMQDAADDVRGQDKTSEGSCHVGTQAPSSRLTMTVWAVLASALGWRRSRQKSDTNPTAFRR